MTCVCDHGVTYIYWAGTSQRSRCSGVFDLMRDE
jgi:hypothetical protein